MEIADKLLWHQMFLLYTVCIVYCLLRHTHLSFIFFMSASMKFTNPVCPNL